VAEVDEVFKALGDPTRIKIVEMLAENSELCVCRIYERLEMTQPAVSHHLAILKRAGLVCARKQGQWVHYSLNRDTLSDAALAFIQDLIDRLVTVSGEKECCAK